MRRWSIAQLLLISCWQLSHGHYKLPPGRSDLNAGVEEDEDLHASSMDDFPVDTAESLETGSFTFVQKENGKRMSATLAQNGMLSRREFDQNYLISYWSAKQVPYL